MKKVLNVVLGALLVAATGCVQSATMVDVNPDGSGKITVREFFSPQVATMFQSMGNMAQPFGQGQTPAPPNGEDASGAAAPPSLHAFLQDSIQKKALAFGPDVKLVRSEERKNAEGWEGYEAVYSFPDITAVKLVVGPTDMGDASADQPEEGTAYTFDFIPGSPANLHIVPAGRNDKTAAAEGEESAADTNAPPGELAADMEQMGADMMSQMMTPMLQGMRLAAFVRVNGQVVESNARYVNPKHANVITLVDMPVDRMLGNAKALALLTAQEPDAAAQIEALKIPGVKMEAPDKTITIQFQ